MLVRVTSMYNMQIDQYTNNTCEHIQKQTRNIILST